MILNETDYTTTETRVNIANNEKKIMKLLSNCSEPEAKEALKLLKANNKLLHRKEYLQYSEDERMLRAGRSNEKYFDEANKASGGAREMAKELNYKYAGKTYKSEYDSIEITKIEFHNGFIDVMGIDETDRYGARYGENKLSAYNLEKIPELVKLSKLVEKINNRTSKRLDDSRYERQRKNDLSNEKRQKQIELAKNTKEQYGKRPSKLFKY